MTTSTVSSRLALLEPIPGDTAFGQVFHPQPSTITRRAFTLLEIMIVTAIMGIIMTMGVPLVYRVWHKEPMRKAVSDVVEVLSNARARAILRGTMTQVVFHPQTGSLGIGGAHSGSGLSVQLPEGVAIDMLDVNLAEYKDADQALVRFYPNGTCDEMTLILHSDRNEQRGITLEITTGLASVLNENDLQKLRTGTL